MQGSNEVVESLLNSNKITDVNAKTNVASLGSSEA